MGAHFLLLLLIVHFEFDGGRYANLSSQDKPMDRKYEELSSL